jgi:hypothetical protein
MKKPEHTVRAIKAAITRKKGKREPGDMIQWARGEWAQGKVSKKRLLAYKGLI